MDLFDARPTLLRCPAWYSDTVQEERRLPLGLDDYRVTPGAGPDDRWTVTSSKGDTVYNGIGPVELVEWIDPTERAEQADPVTA